MFGKRSYCGNCMLVALLILSVLSTSCLSATTIRNSFFRSESISDGQTLVSMGNMFKLGFFSPGASFHRYVGIWYNNVPNSDFSKENVPSSTVVWVANRNNPVDDNSGILKFDNSGNLIIVDGRGSSFTVAKGSGVEDTEAAILDNGNLVLRSTTNHSRLTWQSFDSTTDTWLPEMKIGFVGIETKLTSWRSYDDPATGDYSLGLDPISKSQLFIWWKGNPFWTSARWNNDKFSLIPELRYIDTIPIYFDFGNLTFTYTPNPSGRMTRIVLDPNGSFSIMQFDPQAHLWILLWRQPSSCQVYTLCGAFGVCNNSMPPTSLCQCPKGFAIRDNENTRRGCTRQVQLQCNSDKFLPMPDIQLPDGREKLPLMGQRECESACLRICSCTAYAHSLSEGCSVWHGDLKNMQDNYGGNGVGTLRLRLAASDLESSGSSGHKMLWIVGVVPSVAFLIFCSLLFLLLMRRRKIKGKGEPHDHFSVQTLDTDSAIELLKSEDTSSHFMLFPFYQIANATNCFSPANKLGEGGFGPVYKGHLHHGQDIAVKRLAANSGQGLHEFKNEILLIAKLQHRNLVRLLGCCIQGGEKMLIYEYMPNKSLDFFLFEQSGRIMLDWEMRMRIIEGIVQGLLYLHKHSRIRVIHRDLKASNILLDIDMNPRISDFGMARIFGSKEIQANTNRVVGTYGYMAPEYAMEGIFSVKSDVFSFGVLLLEIISGRRNAGSHRRGNSLNLLGHAWELWKEGRCSELVDPSLRNGYPENKAVRCIRVGLMCVQENAADRPTTTEVISMLTNESMALPDPKQPAFLSIVLPTESDIRESTCSLNELTITNLDGR